jgi:hypothetical protein
MEQYIPHQCKCDECKKPGASATKDLHAQMNLFLLTLTEGQRRLFLGLESKLRAGDYSHHLSVITGVNEETIMQGQRELAEAQTTGTPILSPEDAYKWKLNVGRIFQDNRRNRKW